MALRNVRRFGLLAGATLLCLAWTYAASIPWWLMAGPSLLVVAGLMSEGRKENKRG
jgi:hypothetical protein